jgi:hypothetical protein
MSERWESKQGLAPYQYERRTVQAARAQIQNLFALSPLDGWNVLDADQSDGYVLVVYHTYNDRRSFVDDPAELDRLFYKQNFLDKQNHIYCTSIYLTQHRKLNAILIVIGPGCFR